MTTTTKMGLYEHYKTDASAEREGKWVEFRPGIEVRLRSANSDEVRAFESRQSRKLRPKLVAHNFQLPPADADDAEIDLCAAAVVVAWKGVTGADGSELECTPDNVRRVLRDLPAFRREILLAARMDETFRSDVVEEMQGN